jgi:hypothetical protein
VRSCLLQSRLLSPLLQLVHLLQAAQLMRLSLLLQALQLAQLR